jgi:hypothetical protein
MRGARASLKRLLGAIDSTLSFSSVLKAKIELEWGALTSK